MNTQDCIATKLDIREFSKENVHSNLISTILNSARYSGSGLNTQHWRFVVIKEENNYKKRVVVLFDTLITNNSYCFRIFRNIKVQASKRFRNITCHAGFYILTVL